MDDLPPEFHAKVSAELTDGGAELRFGLIRLQLSRRELRELLEISDGFRRELYQPKPRPTEWAWCEPSADRANGPFASREDALDDAADMLRDGEAMLVDLGMLDYLDPADYAGDDADYQAELILERMFDECRNDGLEVDFIHGCSEASKDLETALWVWAKKHLTTFGAWSMSYDTQRVLIWYDRHLDQHGGLR